MRFLAITVFAVLVAAATVFAQPPRGKAPDEAPPSADRPRPEPPPPGDGPRPRREPRDARLDDDNPPPPGKAGPRPRLDVPGYPQGAPVPVPGLPGGGGFGGGGMRA